MHRLTSATSRATLLATLLLGLAAPKVALAAGLSADPRVPTAPLEQIVVTSEGPDAVVSVWPKRAGRVYVLPKPDGVVPGSLDVLQSAGMGRIDRETALQGVVGDVVEKGCHTDLTSVGTVMLPAGPPTNAYEAREEAYMRDLLPALSHTSMICRDRFSLKVPIVEVDGASLAASVRARGGALPGRFTPSPAGRYWVVSNLGSAMLRYRTKGASTLPLVQEASGGAHETLVIVLMRINTGDQRWGQRPFPVTRGPTAMLPAELAALPAGGIYALPAGLSAAQAEAALAESKYASGAPAVVQHVFDLGEGHLNFDACAATGLGRFGLSFDGAVVRARVRSLSALSFREQSLPPYAAGFFLNARDARRRPVAVDATTCLEFNTPAASQGAVPHARGAKLPTFTPLTPKGDASAPSWIPAPPAQPPPAQPPVIAPTASAAAPAPAPPRPPVVAPPAASPSPEDYAKVARPPGGCATAAPTSDPAHLAWAWAAALVAAAATVARRRRR